MTIRATRQGTEAASSHEANVISIPWCSRAIPAPVGLAAMAVSQSAEEMVSPTIPFIMR